MFETICIRNQNPTEVKNPIDLGFLAEAMLFYRKVRVIGNNLVLRQLVEKIGPDTVIELVKQGFLQVSYQTNLAGINSYNTNSSAQYHSPVLVSSRSLALQDIAPKMFTDVIGRKGRGRRLGSRFAALIDSVSIPESFTKEVAEDLDLTNYVENAAAKVLSLEAPEYVLPQPFEFKVERTDKGFLIRPPGIVAKS